MRVQLTLNSAGFAEVLKSAGMESAVRAATEAVASNVAGQGLVAQSAGAESGIPIVGEVEMQTTDRARGKVTIKHPAALAMQAKHGVLTKAAAAAGLEVRAK